LQTLQGLFYARKKRGFARKYSLRVYKYIKIVENLYDENRNKCRSEALLVPDKRNRSTRSSGAVFREKYKSK
jgi:hypothetical protein